MNTKLLSGGAALLLLAITLPAASYHIDGTEGTSTPGLATSDWTLATPFLIICESEGLHDARNARESTAGNGGLCTTGRNDASGAPRPHDTSPYHASLPEGDPEWTKLNLCNRTTALRNSGAFGPYASGGGDCAAASGSIDTIAFSARVVGSPYTCLVMPTESFYYNETFAWWSYDGSAPYHDGNAVGDKHNLGVGVGDLSNNVDAFHGHIAAFVDQGNTDAGNLTTTGSVEVVQVSGPPTTAAGCDQGPASADSPVRVG